MSHERSVFEQNGIPMIFQNNGRVRREQTPWLRTFSARQPRSAFERGVEPVFAALPEDAGEEANHSQELRLGGADRAPAAGLAAGGKPEIRSEPQNENVEARLFSSSLAAPGMPRMTAAAGDARNEENDRPMRRGLSEDYTGALYERTLGAAGKNWGEAGVGTAAFGVRASRAAGGSRAETYAETGAADVGIRAESAPVAEPKQQVVNPTLAIRQASREELTHLPANVAARVSRPGAADRTQPSVPRVPQVIVRKFSKSARHTQAAQMMVASFRSPEAGGSQSSPAVESQMVEAPMAYPVAHLAGSASAEKDLFSAAASAETAQSWERPALEQSLNAAFFKVAMDAAGFSGSEPRRTASIESKPQANVDQRALLERLNQQSSREQPEPASKRVHIGNLRITVQRAGAPAPQSPAQPQTTEPQRHDTLPQTFINPWDRYYTVFD